MENKNEFKISSREEIVDTLGKIWSNNDLDNKSQVLLYGLKELISGESYGEDYNTLYRNNQTMGYVIRILESIENDDTEIVSKSIRLLKSLSRDNETTMKIYEDAMRAAKFAKSEREGKPMLYIFFGASDGKDMTQKILKHEYNFNHIVTGDIFKNIIKGNSHLSKEVKELMDEGRYINDEITIEVLINTLEKIDLSADTILDGFPRNLKQVELLEEYLERKGIKNYKVVDLDLPKDLIIKKLSWKKVCSIKNKEY